VAVLGEVDRGRLAKFEADVPARVHVVGNVVNSCELRDLLQGLRADACQVEALACAQRIGDPRRLGVPTLYRAYDATFEVVRESISSPVNLSRTTLGRLLEAAGLRRRLMRMVNRRQQWSELAIARKYDRVLCFSREDQNAFERHGLSAGVVQLPMAVSPRTHRARSKGHFSIAFVASFSYFPNVDALAYLLQDIVVALPEGLVWRLNVAGAQVPSFAKTMAQGRNVRLEGYVENLDAFLSEADAFVVPLRFGGGVKLKTMTALARGIPTVTSPAGCTGLAVRDEEHVLIRDSASAFAGALARLADDPALGRAIGDAAQRLIAEQHSPETVAQALTDEYRALVTGARADRRLRIARDR
jgi:glycosyltransferase involved in cell wall biosynthesis